MNYNSILTRVEKPSRYSGGEYNTPTIKQNTKLKFLMCFPDVYEVAMSNLGIRILYYLLNSLDDVSCERCFTPWTDMCSLLKEHDLPLFSLESQEPMRSFDMIGFSLQYELSYSNILLMLSLGKIPFLRADRGEDYPIIMAGGPCAVNPMPLSKIIDLFVVGDGEVACELLAKLYVKNKENGGSKEDFLRQAVNIEGVYVPSINNKVRRTIVKDLDNSFYPNVCQVSNIEAIHDRPNLEVFRGCKRGCRFCQAGFIYRPMRERSLQTVLPLGQQLLSSTGYEELSITSLSTGDYSHLLPLLQGFKEFNKQHKTRLSLPSLRLDSFEGEFTEESRTNSLTFAPEAGTQRLRNVINKNITENDIKTALTKAFTQGYSSVKLYFMIGLPTETQEDLQGIIDLSRLVKQLYREVTGKRHVTVSVSVAIFVPKPFTPFQWEAHATREESFAKTSFLKNELKRIGVKLSYHDSKVSRIETVFARGDERLNEVLISAFNKGAMFDGWSEFFRIERYEEALAEHGIDISDYLNKQDPNACLAWDVVDIGVTKQFFVRERERAMLAKTTEDCSTKCSACGLRCGEQC